MNTEIRIFLTGASGFLGYNLMRAMSPNYTFYASEHRTEVPLPADRKIRLNLMDMARSYHEMVEFQRNANIHVMLHSAAMAQPDEREKNPDRAVAVNLEATKLLCDISRETGSTFVFTSTDLVYEKGEGPHKESDAAPELLYARLKYEAEDYILRNHPDAVVFRCALLFGPDNGHEVSMIRRMKNRIENGEQLTLFTDQFRTPLWAPDIAKAVEALTEKKVSHEIINLGGPERLNRYEFGLRTAHAFGWDNSSIVPVKMADLTHLAKRGNDCSLDCSRAVELLEWHPSPIDECLQRLKNEAPHLP